MSKVYVGIGHGGTDPGAVANGLRESDLNLAIGLLVQAELQKAGLETKISRTEDVIFPTGSKVAAANTWGADVVIDLHHNAGGGAGFEIYRAQGADGSEVLAAAINDAVVATGRKSRGVKTNVQNGVDYFGIIRQTKAVAVLIEYGFIDNDKDAALVTDPVQRQAWAEATAKGVVDYLRDKEAPDVEKLTGICGKAEATPAQMAAFLRQKNPEAPDYAAIYIEEGEAEGIRGDIAFAQSCLECKLPGYLSNPGLLGIAPERSILRDNHALYRNLECSAIDTR